MNNKSRNKVHVFLALFLSTVFVSTFMLKTTHLLFVHHNLTENTVNRPGETILLNPTDYDCPVCDFEFCSFLSEIQPDNQKTPDIFAELQIPQTIDCIVNQSSHHFLLRAPPAI